MSNGTAAKTLAALILALQNAPEIPDQADATIDLTKAIAITKASAGLNAAGGNVTMTLTGANGARFQFELEAVASQKLLADLESSGMRSAQIQKPTRIN